MGFGFFYNTSPVAALELLDILWLWLLDKNKDRIYDIYSGSSHHSSNKRVFVL